MRRREFIALVGGAATVAACGACATGCRMRRIGVLTAVAADDPEAQVRVSAFLKGLQQLGWTDGRNSDRYRWPQAVPATFTSTRQNWLRLRQTPSSPLAARPWERCFR